ncbi:ion channel [Stenotrophomonas sp. CFBP 13725]|uniref:ion channel n=1 Tax=Stenotrophomonas sp. CFBP 13725 TaxID=2775297 RepID=UPI001781563F|nr:ion channel [Stenotrophomonas sp. CFBP 13725]MBD8634962.1 hypothetical protein [Stenotrophomonas sp. CFBP 13725]
MQVIIEKGVDLLDKLDVSGRKRLGFAALLAVSAFSPSFLTLVTGDDRAVDWRIWIWVVMLILSYAIFAFTSHRKIVIRKKDSLGILMLFALVTVVYIGGFASLYYAFPLVGGGEGLARAATLTDAFYFSTATFTTLGFGDILPKTPEAKWIVAMEAILGLTHTVLFIFFFLRNGMVGEETKAVSSEMVPHEKP